MLATGRWVVDWVAKQLGVTYAPDAQGIGWMKDGELIAGLVFEGYNGANIYVHIAKIHGERLHPTLIAAMFDYPFNQLDVRRISAVVNDRNTASMEFARKLGASVEGFMPEAAPEGNLVIFGLLRKDAEKWLRLKHRLGEPDGRPSFRNSRTSIERGREKLAA